MNFCGNCGAPATGSAYCGNCGQPMTAESATRSGQSSQPGPPGPGVAATAAPVAPSRLNPFADIPLLDYARDVIALVLLLVSFGMPWDLRDSATGKVYVILVTLLSVISLALPYLKRGGVLPASWGAAELRLVRLAANAPYVVVVLITLVLGYVGENDGDGVGVAIAFGLAGALVAAQGRQAEQVPDGSGDGVLWRSVTIGLGALFALLTVISLILFLVDGVEALEWEAITFRVLVMLFFLALVAMPVLGVLRGDAAWRDVLVLLGAVALFVCVWQLAADRTIADAWSLRDTGPQLVLVPALAAAVSAPGFGALVRPLAGAAHWAAAAVRLFQVTMLVAVFGVALYIVTIVAVDDGRGTAIVVLVLHLILLLAAVVGRNALSRDPNFGRGVAVVCAGVFALLGIVIAAVLGAADQGFVDVVDATMISVLWWFAAALIVGLTVPASVRQEYGPVSAGQMSLSSLSTAARGGADVPESPAVPTTQESDGSADAAGKTAADETAAGETAAGDDSAGEPAPADIAETRVDQRPVANDSGELLSFSFDARTASDPTTPLQVLADIAAQEPSLRKHVAANPSTYPELLTWLEQLDDPEVNEALRRRG